MLRKNTKIEKVYYSIGEVAEMFDVNTSLIRFWEKEFDVLQPMKNKKGNRLFTQKDLVNLRIIYHLVRERGFTLQGAKDKLKENREDVVNKVEAIDSLNRIKGFLLEIKEQM